MFISKKKILQIEKRIELLESTQVVNTYDFGYVSLLGLCRKLPNYIEEKIKAAVTANNNHQS